MHRRWRNFLVLSGGVGALIGVALILSGSLPFLPQSLKLALGRLHIISESQAAATVYAVAGTQTYSVPNGVVSINVLVWGGGGQTANGSCYASCNGYSFCSYGGLGGGGGYTSADISVTQGQQLTVIVGGINGYSGVFSSTPSQATALVVAGSGGGAGGGSCVGGPPGCGASYSCGGGWPSPSGGAGGGLSGGNANDASGGTQTAGGTGASTGGPLTGGSSGGCCGGKGGSGYYGGGGGPTVASQAGTGGGGGSGYCAPSVTNCSIVASTQQGVAAMSQSAPSNAGNASNPGAVEVTILTTIPAPTVTIAGNGTNPTYVGVGAPVTINATFVPGTGDALVGTIINDYLNNALPGLSPTPPTSPKTYIFTPATPGGDYIFYPAVQTTYYPSWNNYSTSLLVHAVELVITANNTLSKLIIPPNTSADIRWHTTNVQPGSCTVSYATTGGNCVAGAKPISTKGAYNWHSFTIGTDTYLALANAYDGTTYNLNSNIYKWVPSLSCFGKDSGSSCGTAYQSIATNGAATWESFTTGADTYLTLANSRNDSTRNVNSKIYKWTSSGAGCPTGGGLGNGTNCNAEYQSISTSGAVDLKPIQVGADTYLAVANYRNDASYGLSYGINSNIYKWMSSGAGCPMGGGFGDGAACGSVFQAIPTKGAYRMESFTLEGGSYLAVTNAFDPTSGVGYNQPSYIYKYIGSGYNCPTGGGWGNAEYGSCGTPFQAINTSGAYGFKFLTIGNASYLAVANAYDGNSFNINSKIYQWMPGSQCFGDGTTCGVAFQTIPTSGATRLQTFTTGPDTYLIVANAYDGASYNVNSNFYQWMPGSQCFGDGTTCGAAFQTIPTSGAAWWEPVTIGSDIYLAAANYYNGASRNINSSIMKWSPSGCGDTEQGNTPTAWTADNSGVDNLNTVYLTSGTSWPVPGDWNSSNNTIEVIGGGAGSGGNNGGGGGGGGYSKITNVSLTPNASVTYAVGAAGAGGSPPGSAPGSAGGDTYFCNSSSNCASISGTAVVAGAKGGSGGGVSGGAGGTGGAAASGVGSTKYNGGNGGSPGGGGGAAGLHGSGNNGTSLYCGGSGDAGFGGAGGGNCVDTGGAGGNGTEWDSSYGSGGGGGNAAGGLYGGGGGQAAANNTTFSGKQGIIVIKYTVSAVSYQTGLFSGSRLYTLACKWLDGVTASSTSVRVATQAELMLSANGSTTPTVYITPNASALIQWSTKSVQQNSCNVTNTADASNWAADNNPTGYPSPILADGQSITYTLACTDLSGAAASKTMTVTAATPLPSATSDLSISVRRVVKGARPTLTWSAVNLRPGIGCAVTPALQSGVPSWDGTGTSWNSPIGGALGPVIYSTTTFTLTCVNKAGNSASVSATAYLLPEFKEL